MWKFNKKLISRGDNIDMVSVSVVRKLRNMSNVSQEKNVHLWLLPVLQRGSSIKVGDIDFISSWFFLQASPRLVEAAIREQKKYRIWQPFCLGQIQYLDISWPESSKTIRFQGEEMCNGEFDKHGSNAQQNKLHAPYSLTPILQGISSISSIKVAVSSYPIKGVGWT